MAQGEKEADTEGPFALLQHETGRIVDGRDMVSVECVAQTEHVSDEPEADQRGMLRRVVEKQSASDNVQECDHTVEPGQTGPLAGVKASGAGVWRAAEPTRRAGPGSCR
jgi:hypothetical protein